MRQNIHCLLLIDSTHQCLGAGHCTRFIIENNFKIGVDQRIKHFRIDHVRQTVDDRFSQQIFPGQRFESIATNFNSPCTRYQNRIFQG